MNFALKTHTHTHHLCVAIFKVCQVFCASDLRIEFIIIYVQIVQEINLI